jgi:hypothetical protein
VIDSPWELGEHIAGYLGLSLGQVEQAMLTHAPPQFVERLQQLLADVETARGR